MRRHWRRTPPRQLHASPILSRLLLSDFSCPPLCLRYFAHARRFLLPLPHMLVFCRKLPLHLREFRFPLREFIGQGNVLAMRHGCCVRPNRIPSAWEKVMNELAGFVLNWEALLQLR